MECGKLIKVSVKAGTKFCSNTCGYLYRKNTGYSSRSKLPKHKCEVCGREYYKGKYYTKGNRNTRFCSLKCSGQAMRVSSKDLSKQKVSNCRYCGKEFWYYSQHGRKRKLCSKDCYNKERELKRLERLK